MKRILAIALRLSTIGSSAIIIGSSPAQAQDQTKQDQTKREPIRLTSYEVSQFELKSTVRLLDTEGKEQKYDRAYVVTLKGNFPLNQALGFELYVGDYRVPEYGGTHDGLYFRIYDQQLLSRLENKEFRYRFGPGKMRSLDARFSMKRFRNLKIQKEQ
jgi:hypothetical protein